MSALERITHRVLGGPITISPAEIGGIRMQREGARTPTVGFIAEVKLEGEEELLKRLDSVTDRSSDVVVAGGVAVSVYGLVRRDPTIVAQGLGVAAAGFLMAKIDNPARIAVQTQIGYREDALEDIKRIAEPSRKTP